MTTQLLQLWDVATRFNIHWTFVLVTVMLMAMHRAWLREPGWLASSVGVVAVALKLTVAYALWRYFVIDEVGVFNYYAFTYCVTAVSVFIATSKRDFEDTAVGSAAVGLLGFVIWPVALFSLSGMYAYRIADIDPNTLDAK